MSKKIAAVPTPTIDSKVNKLAGRLYQAKKIDRAGLTPTIEGYIAYWILEDPQGIVDALVEAGVMEEFQDQYDSTGRFHTYRFHRPPHIHDWRWNVDCDPETQGDIICVVEGCKEERAFHESYGPNFPMRKQWPKYEGEVPD